jgi:hypothetical protein
MNLSISLVFLLSFLGVSGINNFIHAKAVAVPSLRGSKK